MTNTTVESRAQIEDFSPADAGGPNQQSPIAVIRQQAERMTMQFNSALPAHIPVERFMRVAMTAIQNNPDLIASDRQSLWNAVMRAAQDGLLPDGREGAIVVYKTKVKDSWIKKAQWMPMVFGILKKIRNSGEITTITARVVFGGDKWRYWIDDDGEHVLYEPADNPNTDVVVRVFAMAKTKSGELYVEPMTSADIEKVRSVSRAKDGGPWTDWWEEMAKKTAIRRLAKRLPMSTDLDDLVRRDDELYNFGRSDAQIANDQKKAAQTRSTLDSFAGSTKQIEYNQETGEVEDGLVINEDASETATNISEPPAAPQKSPTRQAVSNYSVGASAPSLAKYETETIAWIKALSDPAAGKNRWAEEKSIRNAINVPPRMHDDLLSLLHKKVATLVGGGAGL